MMLVLQREILRPQTITENYPFLPHFTLSPPLSLTFAMVVYTQHSSREHTILLNECKTLSASFLTSERKGNSSRPFTEGLFVKECLMETSEILCPEKKSVKTQARQLI